tara:strand:- start:298 stop:735 length:438 start_codon:yes stop_codon:yes gene_type:complete
MKSVPDSHIDIMKDEVIGIVATLRQSDGQLSSNPVSFIFEDGLVRFSTLKERIKYRNLAHDNRVSFCVISSTDPTRYVELRGHARLEDDPGGVFQKALWKKMTGEEEFNFDHPNAERVIVTIIPDQVSTPLLYGGQMSQYAGTND